MLHFVAASSKAAPRLPMSHCICSYNFTSCIAQARGGRARMRYSLLPSLWHLITASRPAKARLRPHVDRECGMHCMTYTVFARLRLRGDSLIAFPTPTCTVQHPCSHCQA